MQAPAPTIKDKFGSVLKHQRVRRWGLGLLIAFIALVAISWLAVPHFVNQIATEQVQQQLGRKLSIGELRFSPLQLALTANDISLFEPDQTTPMVTVKSAVMNLSLSSVFRQALVMDEIKLVSPFVHIVRISGDGVGRYNFSDIIDRIAAMPKSDAPPLRFSLANIQLQDGGIQFDDKVVQQHVKVEALQMALPFLSNFPSSVTTYVSPFVSARVNGTPFSLKGRTKPFDSTLDTALALDVEQLDLASYVAYFPVPLPVQLQSAKLTTKLDLVFSRKKEHPELLLSGDVSLKSLAINDKNAAPLLRAESISTHIRQVNIFSGAAAIDKLLFVGPEVWLALDGKGELNWAGLAAKPAAPAASAAVRTEAVAVDASKPAASAAAAAPLPLSLLSELVLQKGIVHWSDAANATPTQELTLKNIAINAKQLSTQADAKPASIAFTANGEHDEVLSFQGELQPMVKSVSGKAELQAIALDNYQPYISKSLAASLSGLVKIKSALSSTPGQFKLDDLSASISDFKLSPKGKSGKPDGEVTVKAFSIDKLSLDTEARSIKLGNVLFDGMKADVRRDQQGQINLQKMVASKPASASSANPANAAENSTAHTATNASWKSSIQKIAFTDAAIAFADESASPAVAVKMEGIKLDIETVSGDLATPMTVALQASINRKGKLAIKGSTAAGLKAVKLDLDGQDLPVASFYPYFSQYMNASLTRGQASIKGKLNISNPMEASRQIAYDGMLKLANFHLLENGASDDFLEWKSIDLDGINAKITAEQPQISLKKLTLSDFYARAILSDKGRLNLQNIFASKAEAAAAAADAATATPVDKKTDAKIEDGGLVISGSSAKQTANVASTAPAAPSGKPAIIRIAQTVIKGGNINFTDNFVKPNYSANLTGLGGSIGAIASDNPQAAAIDLSGKIDNDAPLLISGTLNPLAKPLFLDIKGSANGVELTRLTPYAAKYAGYAIEKGKLTMQVAYHVENQNLQAVNDVRIDQLTFGDRIDSPDATKLPVLLAVALLRDNNGQISVNLPVSGSLSDPQFSIGGVIFKVFVNLITKAVTAPFSLLASAFGGGGEELSYIEFKPGQSLLAAESMSKLDNLAKALKNRSGLKLDIIGRVDPATDTEGLRRESLAKKMKALKLKDLRRAGAAGTQGVPAAPDEVSLDDADRKKYMEEVYSAEKFTKPRNVIGIAKTLPTEEAEKLILSNTVVTPDALRALAQARADMVRDYLEQKGEVGKDRLFLIAPRLTAEGIKDKGATTRVDFSLK
ncbi:DUF748 domain-containing protein [Undibacterium terreum]|uniref:DUF748 domain-containing protein n=1 Tax=Undibacterium terreum TaxID=1224302 RepID=A0A916UH40_9BURK|nr:DUF748 domain-containing protein [Undibacterium terreum]GGC72803.1 hypothetical protein GCM10011396_20000 [Undibacterium terreum]